MKRQQRDSEKTANEDHEWCTHTYVFTYIYMHAYFGMDMRQAMHALGTAYLTGEGAEKDVSESVSWFSKAAETGLAVSCVGLGNVYANGGPGASRFVSEFCVGRDNVLY